MYFTVIYRALILCQALFQALIHGSSLLPYNSLPYNVGTTVTSALQVRNLDSGEAEYCAQGHTRAREEAGCELS